MILQHNGTTQSMNDIRYLCVHVCLSVWLFFQSLSRMTRVVPAVFSAVIDTCGPAAIMGCAGGAGARGQGPAAPAHCYGHCLSQLTHPNTPRHTHQGMHANSKNVRVCLKTAQLMPIHSHYMSSDTRNPDTIINIVFMLYSILLHRNSIAFEITSVLGRVGFFYIYVGRITNEDVFTEAQRDENTS